MTSRLPPLPALRDFIHMYRLRAKKILSQNYLMDMNINRKIAKHAKVNENDWVIEIGPGPGGITRAILEAGASRLDVVEIDNRFIPPLQHLAEAADSRMFIHHKDALRTEIGDIWKKEPNRPSSVPWHDSNLPQMHVIGNLPFNIASPLIIKYLRDMSYRRGVWEYGRVPLTLTFQLEVAKRLCSPIACDTRSRISIMAQYVAEPKMVFQISGSCFVPRPQVDVGVVRFVPRKTPLVKTSFEVLEKLCRQVFHYRQKYVEKGLKTLYPPEMENEMADELLKKCRIDPTTTSIKLGMEQFADLAEGYNEQCIRHPGLFLYDYTNKQHNLESLSKEQYPLPPPVPVFDSPSEDDSEWSLRNFNL
ncbi:unnamed protein product [Caenorhabditis nigoni]|uniref:rRNA adenine N(6)-methyltransferase n=3 Tax=Caenorhabditis nigoni TaxID=1611254 RepID=A0A2G5VHP1_9PELO|nr:hypothetical protein B9Z55_001837 [Caenorhabditis nigoni]